MKLITLGVAAALAVGSIGLANATPDLIQNGDFSSVNATLMQGGDQASTQFGSQSAYGFTAKQFINNWVGNDGYGLWFYNASDATSQDAFSVWGQGSDHDTGKEMMAAVGTTYAPGQTASGNVPFTSFVGLDGDQKLDGSNNQVQASIGQTLTGLTVGQTYAVSFDWSLGQLKSKTGNTTNSLKVSFGDLSQSTQVMDDNSQSFNGWLTQTFNFKADSTSAFLNFLAVGTPSGLPPMALLSNVSVTAVPEPPVLAMFGGGLLGLGLLTVFARRRQQRRDKDGDLAA